jgi:hypothetical protein
LFQQCNSSLSSLNIRFSLIIPSYSTSILLIQLGDSGGIENTGYNSTAVSFASGGGSVVINSTAGFILSGNNAAANTTSGIITCALLNGNAWVSNSVVKQTTTQNAYASGDKTLSDTLTQVRITTVNGTDTFDAGSINILYE